jgi:hypothetical protein
MNFQRWNGKQLFIFAAFLWVVPQFVSELSSAHAREQCQASTGSIASMHGLASKGAGPFRLAEMIQTKDSVIYSTDPKNSEYERRLREEREKEKQSWDMLKNMIIDGRQPPRRFSDPRANDHPH